MIFLTGATGYVGRNVLAALASDQQKIKVIVRPGTRKYLEENFVGSVVETEDLFSESEHRLREVLAGVDTIVHLAWFAQPKYYLDSEKNLECLMGSLNLAKAAVAVGVRRFVGIGTCAEYDQTGRLPISESAPLAPRNLYGWAKVSVFHLLQEFFRLHKTEFAWCRLFYLYGGEEHGDRLVPYVRRRLAKSKTVQLTDGIQVRDFLNVVEAGRQIVKVATSGYSGPINICSGIPITIRDFVTQIAAEYGREDLLEFGALPRGANDANSVVGVTRFETLFPTASRDPV